MVAVLLRRNKHVKFRKLPRKLCSMVVAHVGPVDRRIQHFTATCETIGQFRYIYIYIYIYIYSQNIISSCGALFDLKQKSEYAQLKPWIHTIVHNGNTWAIHIFTPPLFKSDGQHSQRAKVRLSVPLLLEVVESGRGPSLE